MMKLQKDLREFVGLLNSRKARYVIVGGHAVAYHGHPRFTGDIDFLVEPSSENAQRLMEVNSRVAAQLDGIPVCFISKDLLLENKRAAGRAKDMADVVQLSKQGLKRGL